MLTLNNVINNFKNARLGPKILFFTILFLFIGGLVALSLAGFKFAMIILFLIVFGLTVITAMALFVFISLLVHDVISYIFKGERDKENLMVKWFDKEFR